MPAFDLLVELVFGNPSHSTHSPGADSQQNVTVHKAAAGEGRKCAGADAQCHVPQEFQCPVLPGTAAAPGSGLAGAGWVCRE